MAGDGGRDPRADPLEVYGLRLAVHFIEQFVQHALDV